ncbi:hypothetical protein PhaeoP14_01820 [Phaeobacter piscinae]|nr:hypothetical protein PhaeoP14_01820 [Phaeobacter piscinae]
MKLPADRGGSRSFAAFASEADRIAVSRHSDCRTMTLIMYGLVMYTIQLLKPGMFCHSRKRRSLLVWQIRINLVTRRPVWRDLDTHSVRHPFFYFCFKAIALALVLCKPTECCNTAILSVVPARQYRQRRHAKRRALQLGAWPKRVRSLFRWCSAEPPMPLPQSRCLASSCGSHAHF